MSVTAEQFEEILKEALRTLYQDLSQTWDSMKEHSWWRREQELVSLFAFGHLVPIFQRKGIDASILRIEGRVPQLQTEHHKNVRAARDLVVWNDHLDTWWRPDCLPPVAVLEWKLSTSRRTKRTAISSASNSVNADIEWLKSNCHLMGVGYSIFVEWPDGALKITCVRVCFENFHRDHRILVVLPNAASATA